MNPYHSAIAVISAILASLLPAPASAGESNQPTPPLAATQADTTGYYKFRFGGYGEMVASFKDYGINRFGGIASGNIRTHRNTIAIPRFVLAFDYKFNPKWILGAEIEFEAGGTGSAMSPSTSSGP